MIYRKSWPTFRHYVIQTRPPDRDSNIVPHFWFACKKDRKRLAVSGIQKPTKRVLIWRENEHKNITRSYVIITYKLNPTFWFNWGLKQTKICKGSEWLKENTSHKKPLALSINPFPLWQISTPKGIICESLSCVDMLVKSVTSCQHRRVKARQTHTTR